MPTYVDTDSMRVVVLPDGQRRSGFIYQEVPLDRVLALGLNDGFPVTPEQLEDLLTPVPAARPEPELGGTGEGDLDQWTNQKHASLIPHSVEQARSVAAAIASISIAFLVLSVIGGVIIAFQKKTAVVDTFYGPEIQETHPFLVEGLTIAFAGGFQSLLIMMVARYIQARMDIAKVSLTSR